MHIADVSWFVRAGSPLDHGAAESALSTYVPGLVAPMLPPALADDACSLRPLQDRLSVTVEMPPEGEPLFYRSVINSRARLTYGEAQRREAAPEILEQLDLATEVATRLRAARFARGALEVNSTEIEFSFADGRVASAWRQGEPHAHMLVEELMIRANEHVAAFLAGRRRQALFRVHERPDPQSISRLLVSARRSRGADAAGAGAHLAAGRPPSSPARSRAASPSTSSSPGVGGRRFRCSSSARSSRRGTTRRTSATPGSRAPRTATSPRRSAATPTSSSTVRSCTSSASATIPRPTTSPALAEHTSARERAAAQLEYLADDICLAWLLEDQLLERGWDERWEGEITGAIGSGLFVRFGDVFEGMLPARRLHGEFYELNATGTALVGRRSGRRFRLGDRIAVRVEQIAKSEGKVELAPA